jgi:hypothetical protein
MSPLDVDGCKDYLQLLTTVIGRGADVTSIKFRGSYGPKATNLLSYITNGPRPSEKTYQARICRVQNSTLKRDHFPTMGV